MATKTCYKPVESSAREAQPGLGSTHGKRSYWSSFSPSDNWTWEIVCALLGTVLVLVLYLVLRQYDGQPAPRFGTVFGTALTLNTVVSIIVAAARAALLLPVAECVGQLKWIWFSKHHRRLSDMSTFDRASRGLLGGLELLWATKLSNIAALGTVIMLLQLAIDPFSQQLIIYQSQSLPNSAASATIGVAQQWVDGLSNNDDVMIIEPVDAYQLGAVTIPTKNAIHLALDTANGTLADMAPSCPGGNCTFDPYWSLAVCTRMANVSDHVTRENLTDTDMFGNTQHRYHISPSHYLEDVGDRITMMNITSATGDVSGYITSGTPLNLSESIAFQDVEDPIADVFIIVMYNPEDWSLQVSAIEFVLEWCVQNFTTTVTNGVATTQRHNDHRNFRGQDSPNGPDGLTYGYEAGSHNKLQRFVQGLFNGSVAESAMPKAWYATSDTIQLLYEPFRVLEATTTSNNFTLANGLQGTGQEGIEHMINNIATGLTNSVRSAAWTSSRGEVTYSAPVNGTVYQQVLIVVIRWKWIAAHITFAILSLLLLAITVFAHRRSPLDTKTLKCSSAAVLRALDPTLQQELGGITLQSKMDAQDEGVTVRLLPTEEGTWRLVPRVNRDVPLEA